MTTHVTLSGFLQPLANAVKSVAISTWVTAEISDVQDKGHVYITLIETDAVGVTVAKLKCSIWAGYKKKVISRFHDGTGGEKLRTGIKVLVLLKPSLSLSYGLGATIEDIDPSFTLGEAARLLIVLRDRLKSEGIYDNQRKFRTPTEYTRVAVLCPEDSASLGDFRSQADPLNDAGICRFEYFSAAFQGDRAAIEIVNSLRSIYRLHIYKPFDALVIIRGGGPQSDLSWLNEYKIADAITKMPLPVFTAIGHERDSTILDEVAHKSFHTPSKVILAIAEDIWKNTCDAQSDFDYIMSVAGFSVERATLNCDACLATVKEVSNRQVQVTKGNIESGISSVDSYAKKRISSTEQWLSRSRESIRGGATTALSVSSNNISTQRNLVRDRSESAIQRVQDRLRESVEFVIGVGPGNTLQRGFVIARSKGKVITRKAHVESGDRVDLQFADGNLSATVE